MTTDVVALAAELIAQASVNPMGAAVDGPEFLEGRMSDYLTAWFDKLGLPWERHPVHPDRDNVLARLEGRGAAAGELILWDAHQDTVPVAGMTIDPFVPALREGRLYGRGACDVKGSMAAMLSALAAIKEKPPAEAPTIVMACTVNEEFGCTGAAGVVRLWNEGASKLLPRRPDAAIVAEPTDLNVVVAHKGTTRWRVSARGRAAHSSQPALGDNAIYKMARVVMELERFADELHESRPAHPLCGAATLSVNLIDGGASPNAIPDRCTISIDRRLLPGECADDARREVMTRLAERLPFGSELQEHAPTTIHPLSEELNGALAERVAGMARSFAGRGKIVGAPYGTNASTYAAAGVPAIVFGPGSIQQAHTADEWIDINELHRGAEAYFRLGSLSLRP